MSVSTAGGDCVLLFNLNFILDLFRGYLFIITEELSKYQATWVLLWVVLALNEQWWFWKRSHVGLVSASGYAVLTTTLIFTSLFFYHTHTRSCRNKTEKCEAFSLLVWCILPYLLVLWWMLVIRKATWRAATGFFWFFQHISCPKFSKYCMLSLIRFVFFFSYLLIKYNATAWTRRMRRRRRACTYNR